MFLLLFVHSVVWNMVDSVEGVGWGLSRPEQGAKEKVIESKGVVLSNNLAVDVRQPEQDRQNSDDETGQNDSKSNGDFRKVFEVERWSTLVD